MKKILLVLAPLALLTACSTAPAVVPESTPDAVTVVAETNYNDSNQLAQSLMEEWNAGDPPQGIQATSAICVAAGLPIFSCILHLDNGMSTNRRYVVAADGQSWVTAPE